MEEMIAHTETMFVGSDMEEFHQAIIARGGTILTRTISESEKPVYYDPLSGGYPFIKPKSSTLSRFNFLGMREADRDNKPALLITGQQGHGKGFTLRQEIMQRAMLSKSLDSEIWTNALN